MIAIGIREPGPPEVLVPVERPTPAVSAGEVLIKVAAAGVNRPDVMQRQGAYPPPPGASDIPGLEIAGEIVGVASDVTSWRAGERVCALVSGGGYAEYCSAPAPQCLPIPGGLDLIQAAAIPETFFTVWTNVFERGRLVAGETILIHGGSSGIGTTAIQLARAFGARVITTAGSDEKCAACRVARRRSGNQLPQHRFRGQRRATATGGHGVDVVLDMVGGEYLQRNIDCLARDGRLVQIGLLGGAKSQINMGAVLQRRLWITGSTLRARSIPEKAAIARAVHAARVAAPRGRHRPRARPRDVSASAGRRSPPASWNRARTSESLS